MEVVEAGADFPPEFASQCADVASTTLSNDVEDTSSFEKGTPRMALRLLAISAHHSDDPEGALLAVQPRLESVVDGREARRAHAALVARLVRAEERKAGGGNRARVVVMQPSASGVFLFA